MENDRKVSPIMIGFLIFQGIVLIVALAIWSVMNGDNMADDDDERNRSQVIVDGLAVEWLTDEGLDEIQRGVFAMAQRNASSVGINMVSAVVREGTIRATYFEYLEAHYLTAVVDLPVLKQSYQVFYEDAGGDLDPDSSVIVLCLDESVEMIYPDFGCRDVVLGAREGIVQSFLPFFDLGGAEVEVDKKSGEIEVTVYDAEKEGEAVGLVKQAVEELGVSPELFTYKLVLSEKKRAYER